ncbi:c-type cytochrome [Congregibacter sp.]|uniref:c-type cytochrome n=1 Tax=Congregibacter sp. TaxID=2744308 RepID=UPI003F6BE726
MTHPAYKALLLAVLSAASATVFSDQPLYEIGRPASPAAIQAWDIDVRPDGLGLPEGRGSAREGASLYQAQCESCHGVGGRGGPFGSLVGRLAGDAFPFGSDPTLEKTIGNYWPYATTVFDYLRRAMPFDAPGSLEADEVYSLVAYLLAENRIISPDLELTQSNLAKVRMPSRDKFVPDDRRGGYEVR